MSRLRFVTDGREWARELVRPVIEGKRRVAGQVCLDCGAESVAKEYVGGVFSPRCWACARRATTAKQARQNAKRNPRAHQDRLTNDEGRHS